MRLKAVGTGLVGLSAMTALAGASSRGGWMSLAAGAVVLAVAIVVAVAVISLCRMAFRHAEQTGCYPVIGWGGIRWQELSAEVTSSPEAQLRLWESERWSE